MYTLRKKFKAKTRKGRKEEAIKHLDAHTLIPRDAIRSAVESYDGDLMKMSPTELKNALFPKEDLYEKIVYAVTEELDTGKSDKATVVFLFSNFKKAKAFFEEEKEDIISLMDTLSDEWKTDVNRETCFIAEDNCYEKYAEISISKMHIN